MNNVDKLIKKHLRKEYFRAPTIEDMSAKISDYSYNYTISIKVGRLSYYRSFRTNPSLITTVTDLKVYQENEALRKHRGALATIFNTTKDEATLKKLCSECGIPYKKLFSSGYRKGLLTQEGIRYTTQLIAKLADVECGLEKATSALQSMKGEISAFYPYARRIYKPRCNVLRSEVKWLKNQLGILIRLNKKEV